MLSCTTLFKSKTVGRRDGVPPLVDLSWRAADQGLVTEWASGRVIWVIQVRSQAVESWPGKVSDQALLAASRQIAIA